MSKPQDDTQQAQRAIARQQAQRGERNAAEKFFLGILQRNPDDAEALRFVAECRSMGGEQAAAIEPLQLALRLTPEDPAGWAQLGAAQMAANDFGAAATARKPAHSLRPGAAAMSTSA